MNDDRHLTLRDVALAASQKVGGLQGRALDRAAKDRGLTLSYTTVDKMIAGNYASRPKPATLEALSVLSGIPLDAVYEAAKLPMPTRPLAEDLPPDADLLTPEQRRVVIDVVRQFTKQQLELHRLRQELMGNAEHPAPTTAAGSAPAVQITKVRLAGMSPSTPPAVERRHLPSRRDSDRN